MATHHAIPELDAKGLRQFGLTTGGIVAVLFGLFFPWLLERPWPLWPWIVTAVLCVPALVYPISLKPVYYVWMRFGLIANRVMTPLVLSILFFLVITPFGFVRRLSGHDALHRNFDAACESYRVPSQRLALDRLEKPF